MKKLLLAAALMITSASAFAAKGRFEYCKYYQIEG